LCAIYLRTNFAAAGLLITVLDIKAATHLSGDKAGTNLAILAGLIANRQHDDEYGNKDDANDRGKRRQFAHRP
jgi:hypothetical protein